jgi:hypothetical protein
MLGSRDLRNSLPHLTDSLLFLFSGIFAVRLTGVFALRGWSRQAAIRAFARQDADHQNDDNRSCDD